MYSEYVREKILNAGRFSLQLFAEGGNDPDGEGGNESMTFDDFLKLEGNQGEFDKRLKKAIDTAVKNAKNKWDLEHNDDLSEAEKLAKMNREEKAEYRAKKLEEKVAKLEREKNLADLTKEARKLLDDEGASGLGDMLSFVVSDDAEATNKAVKALAETYKAAVAAGVKEALKGNEPGTGGKPTLTKQQIMSIKDPVERQKKIAENIDLFS